MKVAVVLLVAVILLTNYSLALRFPRMTYIFTISKTTKPGSTVGSVKAFGCSDITYSFSTPQQYFDINKQGVLTVKQDLTDANNYYVVEVLAAGSSCDSGMNSYDTARVKIHVVDNSNI